MERRDEVDTTPVLRELARVYALLNWEYFGERLAPAPLLLSDDRSRLGCYVREPRRIELSRSMVLDQPWGAVVEVLKHEMAHQFVVEVLKCDEPSHGSAFRSTCEQLGIDASASGLPEAKPRPSALLERVRKLLALAGSPNQHEAEAAMRLAHRLMLKHNLEQTSLDAGPTSSYSFRHLGRATGRISEVDSVLAALLGEFFFVQPIWVSSFRVRDGKRASILEITGRDDNLVMAEYVHGFLVHAAESLWRAHKREHGIQRNGDRRAFLAGVMRGFGDKLRAERKSEAAAGLVWVPDAGGKAYFRRRHPHTQRTHHKSSAQTSASDHGRSAGRALVMSRPLSGSTGSTKTRLLT
jgi:hypothetical protein